MDKKACTKCGRVLPLECFHKRKAGANGLQSHCRRCASHNQARFDGQEARQQKQEEAETAKRERARIKAEGLKICRACGQIKPRVDFPSAGGVKRKPDCRQCANVKPSALSNRRGKHTPNRFRIEGDVAYIELTDRYDATVAEIVVSASDLPAVLSRGRWNIARRGHTSYVERSYRENGKAKVERLHRFIMQPPPGLVVDHKNGNGCCNTRENLRVVTYSENMKNKKCHREAAEEKEANQAM